MTLKDAILLSGVKTNNLKNLSLSIPKHQLVGIAGVSGSGKTSLISTLAAGAQQATSLLFPPFLQARMQTLEPGIVDHLEGLTFTAIVKQKKFSKNVRSSVSTASGIAPYLRLLFSRAAHPSAGYSPSYSPNDPRGMCEACSGLGYVDTIDFRELLDEHKSLNEGAIRFPSFAPGTYRWKRLVCSGIADADTPWKELSEDARHLLLFGQNVPLPNPLPGYPKHSLFDGVIPRLKASYLEKAGAKMTKKEEIALQRIVKKSTCPTCHGQRLNKAARASRLNGLNIAEVSHLSINELIFFLEGIHDKTVLAPRQNILTRCRLLEDIGLGYLSLDRSTDSLSSGEAQRLRIVGLLGAPLTDATFIMDEPSSGLHPADVDRLLQSLKRLRDAGNTVIIVEHNLQILTACDHIVELGPGAGVDGGEIIFEGHPEGLKKSTTPTSAALRRGLSLQHKPLEAPVMLHISQATRHNLKNVSVDVPVGKLTVVSGVAGSGKSSLVSVLAEQHPEATLIDQLPLAASARSSLLTILGLEHSIRKKFAHVSGLEESWFSPNGKGACPFCKGRGVTRVDMAFMDDVETVCEQCGGAQFNETALSVRLPLGGRCYSIADVLQAHLDEIGVLFHAQADVHFAMTLLKKAGLGYLKLGRTLNTLSGGERQRLKFVRFLMQGRQNEKNVLVLDEITNGLHPKDVSQLLQFLRELTVDGHTVIAVDHHPALIAQADYNIDLGPGAGRNGGAIVFAGTAQELARCEASQTGRWLRKWHQK